MAREYRLEGALEPAERRGRGRNGRGSRPGQFRAPLAQRHQPHQRREPRQRDPPGAAEALGEQRRPRRPAVRQRGHGAGGVRFRARTDAQGLRRGAHDHVPPPREIVIRIAHLGQYKRARRVGDDEVLERLGARHPPLIRIEDSRRASEVGPESRRPSELRLGPERDVADAGDRRVHRQGLTHPGIERRDSHREREAIPGDILIIGRPPTRGRRHDREHGRIAA